MIFIDSIINMEMLLFNAVLAYMRDRWKSVDVSNAFPAIAFVTTSMANILVFKSKLMLNNAAVLACQIILQEMMGIDSELSLVTCTSSQNRRADWIFTIYLIEPMRILQWIKAGQV